MTTSTDLVMPKLGLTMTEGKVARWAIAPGASFAAGDIVVVVETDKIAFDVEAPGAGTLVEILVPEGGTVAVGTPIAQWLPADGVTVTTGAAQAAPEAVPPAVTPDVIAQTSPATTPASGARTVATPYARRLARTAGLDLATVTASNKRRIKAADVEAALTHRAETTSGDASKAAPAQAPQAALPPVTGFTFYSIEVCVDRLQHLIGEIGAVTPDLRPSFTHFVVLAAARALTATGGTIGLRHDDRAPRNLPPDATRRLSTVVAADRAETTTANGPITLMVSDAEGATLVGCAPAGCDATLGVGAFTRVFRPDADDRPVLRTEIGLVLAVSDTAALPDATHFLTRIRTFLENPLVLLAS